MTKDDAHPARPPARKPRTPARVTASPEASESPRDFIQRRMAELAAAAAPKAKKPSGKKSR